ncbi:hypothetical protein, partial [Pseudomonas sp.]|uniref:hypothetical protein n=1 Tax=Pseudomonas sp. TaxID=306 RepID=UPI0025FC3091
MTNLLNPWRAGLLWQTGLLRRFFVEAFCGERACPNAVQLRLFCRSELAREELTGAAFIQETRVIVDVFREQARSY